jgi:predicted RNA-binding protein with PIN domain
MLLQEQVSARGATTTHTHRLWQKVRKREMEKKKIVRKKGKKGKKKREEKSPSGFQMHS